MARKVSNVVGMEIESHTVLACVYEPAIGTYLALAKGPDGYGYRVGRIVVGVDAGETFGYLSDYCTAVYFDTEAEAREAWSAIEG